ncbi:carbohydrate ABC transporter membrane protein 2 (CUT1 family) [Anaerobacterium chartisolvens]|uniref:Carbohydrate ABC transporter membrane protein 2 (CUT1 family) n=1 Tax=Anaerobacterium chartisolvens TaxID=1297424 RepID=A0A369AH27_9FIRM|nr:carbohydrate ABC transporter permease [Anaerobacterium chartisolvens]RCX08670.1 carbohydrate ABC transporter membrane protein 2 (CUT1 family) [Anaerobacterium chartisolvens]
MLSNKKIRNISSNIAFSIILAVILFCTIFPFLWMLIASFKNMVDLLNIEKLLVFSPTVQNYIDVFSKYAFLKPMWNSLYVGVVSTGLALIFGLPTAYSIAREKQNMFASVILIVRIIPAISFLVPWYIIFMKLNITGTYTALILSHLLVALPLIIWIMIPYFESLPKDLEHAAWVDGCSRVGTFCRIMLPLSAPGILTCSLLAFIFSWNNFIFGLVLCTNDTKTLPMAVFNFISYTDVNWAGLMAAAVVITAPILIISLFLQKYIIKGLTAGAVKG